MKGLWLFQAAGLAEHDRDAVAETLVKGTADTLLVKAMDGAKWEGYWDHSPIAVNGFADLEAWDKALGARGIQMWPWVQPDAPGYNWPLSTAVVIYAAIANQYGVLVLDCEPGDDYWYPVDTGDYSGVAQFFQGLRQAAPQAHLLVSYPAGWGLADPPGPGRGFLPFIQAADPFVDGWIPQDYWGPNEMDRDTRLVRQVSQKPLIHSPATFGQMGAILQRLGQQGDHKVIAWDFAHMTTDLYAALRLFDGNETPGQQTAWAGEGFVSLRKQVGGPMGEPTGAPTTDAEGNVMQRGEAGNALWLKRWNRNYWLPSQGTPQAL